MFPDFKLISLSFWMKELGKVEKDKHNKDK